MKRVCMVVPNPMVKGGIAAVVNGYRGSQLEKDYDITYVESYRDGNKLDKLLKGIIAYFKFIGVLLFHKPDIIHIHSSFGPSFYRKLPFIYMSSWAKIPIINHIHGADFNAFYTNSSNKKKRLIKKVYSKCSIIIALSDEWKEKLSIIVPVEKITVVENYSIPHEDALLQRLERKSNNTVLFLGELGKRKGCYDIPDVIKEVKKVVPEVKFILAGAGSAEAELEIKHLVVKKGVEDNVFFPGWVRGEVKDHLLRDADIFFLPSYNEGMPMSILDAMGYGLPIVSTNVGGIPKVVNDGENGFICAPGCISSFSERIIHILLDIDTRKDFSKRSMRKIYESYSLEIHTAAIMKIYKAI